MKKLPLPWKSRCFYFLPPCPPPRGQPSLGAVTLFFHSGFTMSPFFHLSGGLDAGAGAPGGQDSLFSTPFMSLIQCHEEMGLNKMLQVCI